MARPKLSKLIAKHFWGVHNAIKRHDYTYFWLPGGRGSTKSSFVSLEIPQILLRNPDCHAVVLRKYANTLKGSVYGQMQWAIDKLGLTDKFRYLTAPPEITFKKTGQKILFLGVDDPQKIKSLKLPFGYVGIVWMEELDSFSSAEEIRSLNQSLLRGGDKFWEFLTYNPPKTMDNWVNTERLIEEPDKLVHSTTYLNVPKSWLGEEFFNAAERLKQRNEMLYRHEYLGEVTGTGGAVFENVVCEEITDEQIRTFDKLLYGLDFGFAIDPLAFTASYYDKKREILYVFAEIYEVGMKNKRAVEAMKKICENRRVVADSAEPRTIAEMRDLGLRVVAARKGPDSIDHGIRWLQNLQKIVVDKNRCPNTYRELVSYEYDKNKNGQFISSYPDKNNHSIDSIRYATESLMREPIDIHSAKHTLF